MFYIQYDDIGNLLAVTNEVPKEPSFITIDEGTFIKFVSGKQNLLDFAVVGLPLHAPVPVLIKRGQVDNFDVDKSIHEIEKTIVTPNKYNMQERDTVKGGNFVGLSAAFYIIQNKKKNKWQGKGKISKSNISLLLNNKYLSVTKTVYVTEKNNPNVLIGELEVDVTKFVTNKLFDITANDKSLVLSDDVSLYCPVIFEKFYHLVEE